MKLKCSIEELLEKRKEAITVRIEFSLSDPAWDAFTCAFAYCWDNAIDAGGKIYPQIFLEHIEKHFHQQQIDLPSADLIRLLKVTFLQIKLAGFLDARYAPKVVGKFPDEPHCPDCSDGHDEVAEEKGKKEEMTRREYLMQLRQRNPTVPLRKYTPEELKTYIEHLTQARKKADEELAEKIRKIRQKKECQAKKHLTQTEKTTRKK